jgi:hypothetical protein
MFGFPMTFTFEVLKIILRGEAFRFDPKPVHLTSDTNSHLNLIHLNNLLLSPIKIILITPPSVIKMYLYVYMPLHDSLNNNHHQKAKQHLKETTITWHKIHLLIFMYICIHLHVSYTM